MLNVIRSEWAKLMRPGMILGGAGALIGLGVAGTLMVFSLAQHGPAGPGPVQGAEMLELTDGFVRSFVFSSQILGATSLVLFARIVTADYAQGTLKVLLAREPNRTRLLAGKYVTMAAFVATVLLLAVAAMLVVATVTALNRGLDISAWWTPQGWGEMALGVLRLEAGTLVWGLFGFAIGAIVRNGAAANGIGIGAIAIGGHLTEMFWDDAGKWLPDLVLGAFAMGGNGDISLANAGGVVALYAAILGTLAWFAYNRGDVTA
ncbi:MAG: ABC transporter permease [Candidatus Thermoplasmatota archaeon]|jgi:ABC-type transport system involved in multi-copper enzyme maturation permease subunit